MDLILFPVIRLPGRRPLEPAAVELPAQSNRAMAITGLDEFLRDRAEVLIVLAGRARLERRAAVRRKHRKGDNDPVTVFLVPYP